MKDKPLSEKQYEVWTDEDDIRGKPSLRFKHKDVKEAVEKLKEVIGNKEKEYDGLEQIQEAHWVLQTLKWFKPEIDKIFGSFEK